MQTTTKTVTTTTEAVSLAGVGKVFRGADGSEVHALDGVDLTIAKQEFICLLGGSGCGKSTLLRIVAGFETPSAGQVTVGGKPVAGPGPDRGVVFQDYGLFPWLTVAENVGFGLRRRRMPRPDVDSAVKRFLALVGLEQFATKFPNQLSGGMQQRVAIARVLANDPSVLLMDEPFGALDSLTRETMQHELQQICDELLTTVVFVTHSVEEAVYLADRVVVMGGGPSTGTPGHIEMTTKVGLAHPRDVTSPEFNEIKRGLLSVIHQAPPARA
ncbi:MAG TPA: ABC transporter ATP-binding protein [Acidimicrobiales bacterium]|nr:ABC transporter ATP-binding protein [Acidimicrobiales bacterium]